MTRNEAKEFDTFSYNGDMEYIKENSVAQRIDIIFDYFEKDFDKLNNRSCSNCKKVLFCKRAEEITLNYGFKLSEISFSCWEQKPNVQDPK